MLNVFLAVPSIVLCFPLGVLLALGRRSTLPIIRGPLHRYIELFRGMPLFVLLLMANVALGFFVPPELAPGKVVRAIVVFTLFTGAYMAEIVRGGLQSLPPGQEEAAKALGLSPIRTTFLVVLPQALRNVIPAAGRPVHQPVQGHDAGRRGHGPVRGLRGGEADHAASRVRRAGAPAGGVRLRRPAVLGRVLHHVEGEPAARAKLGVGHDDERRTDRRAGDADATRSPDRATPIIELEHVDKFFGDFQALRDVT